MSQSATAKLSAPPAVIVTTPQALAALVRDAVGDALNEARQNAGPLLLDRTSVARVLGIGTSSVDRFRKAGMPCVWVGDTPRFIVDECLAWLRENRREPKEVDCAGNPANDL
ncbi:MAG TPA: hypothetical protein VJU61_17750 [Polyangiaceae bacterium]|nr:hypothetical protein [Polyangiaceae bacterium]